MTSSSERMMQNKEEYIHKYLESLPLQLENGVSAPRSVGPTQKAAIEWRKKAENNLTPGSGRTQKAAVSAPKAKINMSVQEWDMFHSHWKMYKSSTEIHETRLGRLLYFACEPQLQRKVSSLMNNPMEASEMDMLTAIKSCCLTAPKQSTNNYSIQRRDFVYIQQKPDETANRFLARLRMSAENCNWKSCSCQRCPGDCGYDTSEEHVREQLLRGMMDKDLQEDLMERDESFRDIKAILSAMMARENARARAKSEEKEIVEQSSSERKTSVDYSDLVGKLLLGLK